jgi:mono/diheme cytochrome c family protein
MRTILLRVLPLTLAALIAGTACGDDDDKPSGTGGGPGTGGKAATGGSATTTGGAAEGGSGGGLNGDVARGDYLVNHVLGCPDCHTPRQASGAPDLDKFLAGNAMFADLIPDDTEKGLVPTPNLTPDAETGLGTWTDDQVKNAILNGVDDEDEPLVNIMPYYMYHNLTDADADAVVAYLRSIPAVSNEIPERQDLPFPVVKSDPIPLDSLPDTSLEASDAKYASAQNGKYLASVACVECHTAHTTGSGVPIDLTKLFAGGEDFPAAQLGLPSPPFPEHIYSANLTPDATGIKGWTAEDVKTALKTGVQKDGGMVCPPMPAGPMGILAGMKDQDALDLGNYLLTISPIENAVVDCELTLPGGAGGAGASGGAGGSGGSGG